MSNLFLWVYRDNAKQPIPAFLAQWKGRASERLCAMPTICFLSQADLDAVDVNGQATKDAQGRRWVAGLQLRPSALLQVNHFRLGVQS